MQTPRQDRLVCAGLGLLILALNVLLNAPLFMHGELPFRGSIEGGYVSIARFVAAHPNPWGWNPYQYCGIPTRFLYVPVLPYTAAFLSHVLPHSDIAFDYRVVVSLMTCLGPVTAFFFALYFTGSRKWSVVAAVIYSFLSPSYGLFPAVEKDRGIVQLPWRVQVLAKYGEGPHNTVLTLMPLVLLALWVAAKYPRYRQLFVAAVLLATVPLVNWVGAFALTIACVLFLLAALGEEHFAYWRIAAAGILGYFLACFWLTPAFVKTIVFNWPTDSFAYQFNRPQQYLVAGLMLSVIVLRGLFHWLRAPFYLRFTLLAAFAFGWIATAFYVGGVDTIPESRRYAVEFELFLALSLAEAARLAMRSANSTVRMCAIGAGGLLLLAGTPQLFAYVAQGWGPWAPVAREETVEFRLARWMAEHPPQGRVFASGGLRFRMNSWFDLAQVGGGFETGLLNRMPWDLAYHIRTAKDARPGHEAEDILRQLAAMDTQYLVIHGPRSREYYRDFVHPERITGTLAMVHREEDDAIYALPARPLAHLVRREELPGEDPAAHPEGLMAYVAAKEDPQRPVLKTAWATADNLVIDGAVRGGDLVAVSVNADPGWRALQNGGAIPIETDNLGFILLRPEASGAAHIELQYRSTAEPRIMAVVCAIAWAAAIGGLFVWRRRLDSPMTN